MIVRTIQNMHGRWWCNTEKPKIGGTTPSTATPEESRELMKKFLEERLIDPAIVVWAQNEPLKLG